MNPATIILSSVRYYWRTHLGVVLGSALGAMVLIGALLVGDSVKATLKHQALLRIGKADAALVAGDRFFREQLAEDVGGETAPALFLRGSVSRADGSARVNQAQVLGVDARFWKFAPNASFAMPADQIALSQRAAGQLGAAQGDTVIVRVEKPGAFSRDAPLSGEESEVVAIRAQVARVIADEEFGRFSLAASQVPPFSVFVPLGFLQEKLAFPGKANLLLARGAASTLGDAVKAKWTLEDAALELRELAKGGGTELRTPRVFLDPSIVEAAPPGKNGRRVDVLTYFVNAIAAREGTDLERATPYSMVTALDTASSGFLPAELADDEIVVSQWLADDLRVKEGDKVTLKYFVMGDRRELTEKARTFTILTVLPQTEPQLDSSWMPDFPGLKDAQNCREWQPGFAIDMSRMRAKDNEYWEQHRGTPKAFVNLRAGQGMWGNRWGRVTAVRWPAGTDHAEIERELRAKLTPEKLGFQFIPLREQALAATDAPVDFGQLFVSFSFFLIAAAAVLTGLLFTFTLEQRNAEAGTLLALGLPPRRVRWMLLAEGALLALLGALLGLAGAFLFTRLVLRGLSTVWRGAVGAVEFEFSATPESLLGGAVASVLTALLAMWLASRRQLRKSARELLSGEEPGSDANATGMRFQTFVPALFVALGMIAGGAVLLFATGPEAFFGAGALFLIAGISLAVLGLRRVAAGKDAESLGALGLRNAARRRGRSLATIAVLASGVFMVVAVDSFRHRPLAEDGPPDPGTGGFALVGESALPIYEDLNTPAGRAAYALDDAVLRDVRIVPLRLREGDDASCLNLNRALQPRLLGLKPAEFAARRAFSRATKEGFDWNQLDRLDADGAIPAVVDATTLKYALKMKLGDTLTYRDEHGRSFPVRLAGTVSGTILQGNVIVAEKWITEGFPSAGGYRYFLIEAPATKVAEVRSALSRALEDRGLEITSAQRRLAEFQAVENTYLSIFQVLGGLGLLLGSAGLAIVVARNVLERRREFGLFEAVGFRPQQLRGMVFAEHRWLILAALLIGTVSAIVAVWPNLAAKSAGFPWREIALLLIALSIGCIFWTWLATRIALRGSALAALRAE